MLFSVVRAPQGEGKSIGFVADERRVVRRPSLARGRVCVLSRKQSPSAALTPTRSSPVRPPMSARTSASPAPARPSSSSAPPAPSARTSTGARPSSPASHPALLQASHLPSSARSSRPAHCTSTPSPQVQPRRPRQGAGPIRHRVQALRLLRQWPGACAAAGSHSFCFFHRNRPLPALASDQAVPLSRVRPCPPLSAGEGGPHDAPPVRRARAGGLCGPARGGRGGGRRGRCVARLAQGSFALSDGLLELRQRGEADAAPVDGPRRPSLRAGEGEENGAATGGGKDRNARKRKAAAAGGGGEAAKKAKKSGRGAAAG